MPLRNPRPLFRQFVEVTEGQNPNQITVSIGLRMTRE